MRRTSARRSDSRRSTSCSPRTGSGSTGSGRDGCASSCSSPSAADPGYGPHMAFLRRGKDDAPAVRRFQMREKLMSIGDDSWIEDEHGDRCFKVDGKAMRMRETFILEDRDGREVAKIQERK